MRWLCHLSTVLLPKPSTYNLSFNIYCCIADCFDRNLRLLWNLYCRVSAILFFFFRSLFLPFETSACSKLKYFFKSCDWLYQGVEVRAVILYNLLFYTLIIFSTVFFQGLVWSNFNWLAWPGFHDHPEEAILFFCLIDVVIFCCLNFVAVSFVVW